MTYLLIEDDLQMRVEARRMDIKRMWPDNLKCAMEFQLIQEYPHGLPSTSQAIHLIAQLTLAIETGAIT